MQLFVNLNLNTTVESGNRKNSIVSVTRGRGRESVARGSKANFIKEFRNHSYTVSTLHKIFVHTTLIGYSYSIHVPHLNKSQTEIKTFGNNVTSWRYSNRQISFSIQSKRVVPNSART